jgi:hypothetical protein
MGDLDHKPLNNFEDSLSLCRPAGFRHELAWTCSEYAETLSKRDDEGDPAKAMSLLDESLTISTELGMRPLMERVLDRQEIL